jgi:SAM-dependent methyltransferase
VTIGSWAGGLLQRPYALQSEKAGREREAPGAVLERRVGRGGRALGHPRVVSDVDLGDDVLEVGPGPGLTTDVLRRPVARLTAVEVDQALADTLSARLAGSNVEVVHTDATDLPFPSKRFSAALCFTMLHHVPSVELQDRLFA